MLALLQAAAEDLQLIEALDEEDKCWSGAGLLEVQTRCCSLTLPPARRQLQYLEAQLPKQQSCCRLGDTGQGALQLWPLRQMACNQLTAGVLTVFRSVLFVFGPVC